ncbi:MAG: hypothetical protein V4563_15865 [Pseudomonadota bacterium]
MSINNAITELDASGPYESNEAYAADLADPRIIFDGGWRAAVARKAARSPKSILAPAPVKAPPKSWVSNPGQFPLNADGSDPNQSTPSSTEGDSNQS